MRLLTSALALVATMSTAYASDLDNTQLFNTIQYNDLSLTLETNTETGLNNVGLGYAVLDYNIAGSVFTTVDVFARYYTGSNTMLNSYYSDGDAGIGAVGTIGYGYREANFYAGVGYEYIADADTFENGNGFVTPIVGMSYDFSRSVALFTEATYKVDASSDWQTVGGTVEVGADFALNDTVSLRTSVLQEFDVTGRDATQIRTGLTVSF